MLDTSEKMVVDDSPYQPQADPGPMETQVGSYHFELKPFHPIPTQLVPIL